MEKQFLGADKIYKRACRILVKEIKEMDDRGNKMIGAHLKKNILPGYACYKALINSEIDKKIAIDFVERLMCDSAQRMANRCKLLSTKKYGYKVFNALFKLGFKFGYPKVGWTIEWIEQNKQCIRFDITTCLYCEELEKRNALELCPAFCKTDHVAYDPLAPSVIFERKGTLAKIGTKCDFCFRKGRI
ncbi:MAG: L-2-amino-thiazoline-4-carboxylic acid hydrolase [Lachnospiraceae bacterium]|nr:L-2-amino-thiazoline-4-carboxylic acid hydrolase [Lachnospiraceae bacterium]